MSGLCVAVAYSGGRDSTALLHATLRGAAAQGVAVVALHVHHGLSPRAEHWLQHARATCARWARNGHPVRFRAQRLTGAPPPGASVEAWARVQRYAALEQMARAEGASLVLLAHHRRDQAETLLLQALRGAGVDGLSSMPSSAGNAGLVWARPWLASSSGAIAAYVKRHRLAHVEDESNADTRYARNRLRLSVWPALTDAFPQAEASLARAAAWAQEASGALAELAAIDLLGVGRDGGIACAPWAVLSRARRSNVLRAWLRCVRQVPAPAALIERVLAEWPAAPQGRWTLPGGELRSHGGVLRWHAVAPGEPVEGRCRRETSLAIGGPGLYRLPGWSGAVRAAPAVQGGLALTLLSRIELLPRRGAERFQAGPARPPRALKKQYQAAGVPAWLRTGPLLYSAQRLLFVPGLGADARVLARPDEPQLQLDWVALPECISRG